MPIAPVYALTLTLAVSAATLTLPGCASAPAARAPTPPVPGEPCPTCGCRSAWPHTGVPRLAPEPVIIPSGFAPPVIIPSLFPRPPCEEPRIRLLPPVVPAPPPMLSPEEALRAASVNGRHTKLLAKVHAPDDLLLYGAFSDWGEWTGTEYAGVRDLPPGHWVYVHPHWYVWERGP